MTAIASQMDARSSGAENVFERLLSLSHDALDALESGDMERLSSIMLQRAGTIEAHDGQPNRPEQLASALKLRDADTRLELALTGRRNEIDRDLDTMDSGEVVRSAYGSRSRGKGQINVVR